MNEIMRSNFISKNPAGAEKVLFNRDIVVWFARSILVQIVISILTFY